MVSLTQAKGLFQILFVTCHEFGNHGHNVTNDSIVGDGINRSLWISIDADYFCTLFHSCAMLNGTTDTTGDIQFGTYGDTCLAYLTLALAESCVDSGTGCSHATTDEVSKLMK